MVAAHRIELPFRRAGVNAWLLPDDPVTLVDCGPASPEAWRALEAGLAGHHLRPGDVAQVVVTHAHADHFGNARRLHDLGAEVLASPEAAAAMERFEADSDARWAAHKALYDEAGLGEEALERLRQGHAYYAEIAAAVPEVARLAPGDAVAAGGATLKALDAAGHAPGHLALHDAHGAQVFTGDALLERMATNAGSLVADAAGALADYLESLDRFEALGAARVLPGHGEPFRGAAEAARKHRAHVARRRERVRGILEGGPRTAAEVIDALYVGRPDPYLALSETLGYLESMKKEGEAEATGPGGEGARAYRLTGPRR